MFDIFRSIIDHTWDNTIGAADQSYIYYGCIALIILFSIWLLDRISVFIISLGRGVKK